MNAIKIHRLGHWCYNHKIPIIPKLIQLYIFVIHSSRIPSKTIIGRGTTLTAKGMGVIFNGDEIIGEDCKIGHHVKMLRKNPYNNCAKIGNRVFISSGAVIMGNVEIGNNVIIGANSVVTKSIPDGYIVGGIPASIIGHISEINYDIHSNPKGVDGYAKYLVDKRNY